MRVLRVPVELFVSPLEQLIAEDFHLWHRNLETQSSARSLYIIYNDIQAFLSISGAILAVIDHRPFHSTTRSQLSLALHLGACSPAACLQPARPARPFL